MKYFTAENMPLKRGILNFSGPTKMSGEIILQEYQARFDLTLEIRKSTGKIINSGIMAIFTQKISHKSQGITSIYKEC